MGVDYFLQEIARRDATRQTNIMLALTGVITVLTLTNVGAVLLQVYLACNGGK